MNNLSKQEAQVTSLANELSNNQANVSTLTNNLLKQEAEITALKNDKLRLQSGGSSSGSTYVRWGKKSCPSINGTTLVYSGYAAGSLYSNTGGAANHLCLSPDPIWDHYTNARDAVARVYGVEYKFRHNDADKLRHTAFFGKRLDDQNAPCSVCQTQRATMLMIPGRNACYKGWTIEYSGYLVAGYYSSAAATEYICLDKDPEFNVGGYANDAGALLYLVEAVCGSLECPPYINGRELTCAVCSK